VNGLANIKSAKKRAKLAEQRALRNRAIRSRVRTAIKKAERAQAESDRLALVREAQRQIDKAVTKGVLHKNAARRRKSRLMKQKRAALSPGA
jgi:small subunit ribosomal protein S20